MDQNVGGYQTSMPSKIWKLSFFVFVADCFLQNAWITYGMASSNINILLDWLAFKKQVALVYGQKFYYRLECRKDFSDRRDGIVVRASASRSVGLGFIP